MTAVSGVVYDTGGSPVADRTVRAYRRDTGAMLGMAISAAGPAGSGDSSYASTGLLLRGNSTDAVSVIFDESFSPKPVTAFGNTQISTSGPKYGSGSILFDGTGDYLSLPDSADWSFGTGNFTIGFWYKFAALPTGAAGTVATNHWVYSQRVDGGNYIYIYAFDTGWVFDSFTASVQGPKVTSSALTHDTSTWHYFELVRNGTGFTVYVDGVSVGTQTNAASLPDLAAPLELGRWSGGNAYLNGRLDDIHVSKGVARHTSAFSGSLPTEIIPGLNALAAGGYAIDLAGYTGELQVVCLDNAGGTTENDLIIRTTGV